MTILEFEKLTFKKKGELVLLRQGKFISYRTYYDQKLVLYDMGDFFVEVWYDSDENKITDIQSLMQDDEKVNLYF